MNVYDLLGVTRDSAMEDIKRAYRRLAKELHPDVNAGDSHAGERFKQITAAYNLLAERGRRAAHDREASAGGPEAPSEPSPEPWRPGGEWFEFELDETTGERLMDLFGDIAGKRLGRVQGGEATSLWMEGRDIAETVKVTRGEAHDGICRIVTTMTGLSVAIDIPPRTGDGKILTLPGFGIEGFGGAPPGDLNIKVRIVPDPALGPP